MATTPDNWAYTSTSAFAALVDLKPSLLRRVYGLLAMFAVALWAVLPLEAEVKLPGLFGDNMVLQQGMATPVWGWADDGEAVTVSFRGQTLRTTAKDGKWQVKLRKLDAGGPDTLTISGLNTIELTNVLVGEVWVCSGQSNMEWALSRTFEPQQAIAKSGNPVIRLYTVPRLKASEPASNISAAWKICGPDTVADFSAVAYYFGRDLQSSLGVPIGLIHTSWGGSPAEAWMSQEALEASPVYAREILEAHARAMHNFTEALNAYEREASELAKEGKKIARNKPAPPHWQPAELYNGMIAPLIPFAIRGAIWYQGESNAGRAHQYRALFPDMIRNWRRDWQQGDFPFLAVQLAPWDKGRKRSLEEITANTGDSDWAELREAQLLATKVLPKTGLAVITDAGDKDDIHPGLKEPVGARLALAARGIAYGEKIVYSGPIYKRSQIKSSQIVLRFDHAQSGLEARGGDLQGFAIAGPDRQFVRAEAQIQGSQVVVSSPQVPNPVAVRYGWSDFPVVNLWNKDGLPASPFRTDDFPMITQPKQHLSKQ
jgi:sialate O-acetylesterase